MIDTLGQNLQSSFNGLWNGIVMSIPTLIIAIVLVIIGWGIGKIFEVIICKFMESIKFDEALKKAGVEDVVKRAGLTLNSGRLIGGIIKYFFIVLALIVSFDMLGLNQVTAFLQQVVVGFLPQLIIAVLILLVGGVVGDVVSRIVTASAKTASLSSANLLGTISRWSVWIFSVLVALSQMGIAGAFIQTLFTGFVVAVSLALGLSFGLGGQEAASEAIRNVKNRISDHH